MISQLEVVVIEIKALLDKKELFNKNPPGIGPGDTPF